MGRGTTLTFWTRDVPLCRGLAQAASLLEASQDPEGAQLIQSRMKEELTSLPLAEALAVVVRRRSGAAHTSQATTPHAALPCPLPCQTWRVVQRAFGHYLALSSIAELQHR